MLSTRLLRNIRLGIKDITLHKMRSFLTMLGVVFGVGSVVAMLAVGEGASEQALAESLSDTIEQFLSDADQAIEDTKPLPGGRGCRMPGARGWKSLNSGSEDVAVLESHWAPFFDTQAGRHGWTEDSLRAEWEAAK